MALKSHRHPSCKSFFLRQCDDFYHHLMTTKISLNLSFFFYIPLKLLHEFLCLVVVAIMSVYDPTLFLWLHFLNVLYMMIFE